MINLMLFPYHLRPAMFHRYSGDTDYVRGTGPLRRWLCRHGIHAVIWQNYRDSTSYYGYCDWCKQRFEIAPPAAEPNR